ncbi:MAG: SDR family oxidoreductase [Flavobacteriales bacterium]|nr:SDR family oxidoreductase [Flavobacteriales bacterium]
MAVLITGASRGIGKALTEAYRASGKRTITIGRGEGLRVDREGQHIYIRFAWDDFNALAEALHDVSEAEGFKIESVINNAGLLIKDMISEVSYADFEEQMRVNVWYALELFRALYSRKLLAPNAHILNIGSMGGVQGSMKFPGLFAYSASKAALVGLTESLDAEYGGEGLAFNCLALGAVNTEMLKEAFPGYVSEVDPENMAKFIQRVADEFGDVMSGKLIQASKSNPDA